MVEKSTLLGQLRIDRSEKPAEHRPTAWWVASGAVAVAISAGAWMAFSAPAGVPVQSVVVPAPVAGSAAGAALLEASGYVVARRQATVSAKIIGKVSEVLIEEGQRVEKDQVMARLDDSNALAALAQAQAQVQQAQSTLAAAQAAYENIRPVHARNEQLQGKGDISMSVLDISRANFDAARTGLEIAKSGLKVAAAALTTAQRSRDDTVIRAPFAGIVTVKAAQAGEIVSPSSAGGGFTRTGIGTIVDMDSLEVEVDVSESFISRVHRDQPATSRRPSS